MDAESNQDLQVLLAELGAPAAETAEPAPSAPAQPGTPALTRVALFTKIAVGDAP